MDFSEELVMLHLTRSGKVFVCPQYSISAGWSCPDFVALDFNNKTVSVVEVSAAAGADGLLKKVLDRENQWIAKLREQLRQAHLVDHSWTTFQVVLYIRRSAAKEFQKRFSGARDMISHPLEEMGFPWDWDWPSAKA